MNEPDDPEMMRRCLHESRLQYLLRVTIVALREQAPDAVLRYDEAECDGLCLADDLRTELDSLP